VKVKIALCQMKVAAADPEANLAKAEKFVAEAAAGGCTLICFPEMWTTGFNWHFNASFAPDHGAVAARIGALAAAGGLWIGGSFLELDERSRPANTFVLFDAQGRRAAVYRKTHLFTFMGEERHMAAGERLTAVETPWGKTGLAVCYDLRFPELFRTYALSGVGLCLLPAAFPHPRLQHWRILTRARAIENQMFFAAVNQVGEEAIPRQGRTVYFGHSCIIDPWGETLAEAGEDEETLVVADIDLERVEEIRNRMRVLKDRRPELYRLS